MSSVLLEDAEIFEMRFRDAPDLEHLTWASRRVLAMAAALFYRQGAAATSVRQITRACGLTPGALYKHFASKDDLLYTIVEHGHCRLEQRIADALADVPADPVLRTSRFVHAYAIGHLENPQLAQVIRREYLHLSTPRYEHTVARRRRLRDQLGTLLRRGQAAGSFELIDGKSGATRVAVMIMDMCSRTSEWYRPGHAYQPRELADRYVVGALRLAGCTAGTPTA